MSQSNVLAAGHLAAGGPARSVLAFWVELFSGRYRIVDWYDRGGRRYVVARRRAARDTPACLTARQERALELRASGQALKVIAAELGVSLSTASRELERALELVGLDSEADLAALLGDVAGRAMPGGAATHG